MTGTLDDLAAVLAAQAQELRQLVPLLDEQQAALTQADSARVAAVMFRQDPILRRLLKLDQRRQAVAGALAAQAGLPGGRLSLSAHLGRLPHAPAALRTLQRELSDLLAAVDTRSRRNAFLLDRAVASVEGLLRAVRGPGPEPSPVYAESGQPAPRAAAPRLLDRSA